uniref:Transcriptional regulatory protein n=1 Tax=Kwoniella dejecticola CBS 10117 TaxID=1296121 RepID=A0A1A6A6Z9_9TREE|nr:transcriptional regulatory protein [Kwoniella dejecticola CBS 10117]OBR85832.1 transcriptional regulatory protein [Kwoniella dejecticola CBS 10117]
MNGYSMYEDPNGSSSNPIPVFPGLSRTTSSSSSIHQYNPNQAQAQNVADPYTYLHSQLGASSLHSQLGASSLRGIVPNLKPTSFNSFIPNDDFVPINPQQTQQIQFQHQHTNSHSTSGPSRPSGIAKKKSAKKSAHLHGINIGNDLSKNGESRKKRNKRSSGKACVYCRRSHMVCEGGRPCERCIKREIPHLCRDFTPPPHAPPHSHSHQSETSQMTESPQASGAESSSTTQQQSEIPQQLAMYSDPNFPPTWPLLSSASNPMQFNSAPAQLNQTVSQATPPIKLEPDMTGNGTMAPPSWGTSNDDSELAALNKFMKDLGVPALPGDFFSFMNSLDGSDPNNSLQIPMMDDNMATTSSVTQDFANLSTQNTNGSYGVQPNAKGKGKVVPMSRVDKFMMAAADQPNGTRAARLAQVIKAKYDAGLLKPYDYVKGYERMNKWMESGRAAPRMESRAGSETDSPGMSARNGRMGLTTVTPHQALGKSISPDSRRRILAALAGFRPKFRQIARTLTNVDLVFVEEAMERWMLEYDRTFASIHTPSCIWRRTGEIQKANQEFSNLTGIPASMFRDGQLCVYELMDEDSAVRYWEGYAKIAFDQNQRSMYISCTLHIPLSLIQHKPRHLSAAPTPQPSKSAHSNPPYSTSDLSLPQSFHNDVTMSENGIDEFREIKCCFSVTIRRDTWGVPVAIMGQWIPI